MSISSVGVIVLRSELFIGLLRISDCEYLYPYASTRSADIVFFPGMSSIAIRSDPLAVGDPVSSVISRFRSPLTDIRKNPILRSPLHDTSSVFLIPSVVLVVPVGVILIVVLPHSVGLSQGISDPGDDTLDPLSVFINPWTALLNPALHAGSNQSMTGFPLGI
jgi:hypothetical protein